jgi:cyclic di-GMP phosphodiesterase Gmr
MPSSLPTSILLAVSGGDTDLPAVAAGGYNDDISSELAMLREIVRLLPVALTVRDEHSRLLLANDAAAALFDLSGQIDGGIPIDATAVDSADSRHRASADVLRNGRSVTVEEVVESNSGQQALLTTHRPIRIADRALLVSNSTDITEQKLMESELFKRAFYDELTGLPLRQLVEQRANGLLRHETAEGRFALAFIDLDNFKHINDYYGHAVGDALLTEFSRRLGRDLRTTDTLSRISGDEFLLLLSPVSGEAEVLDFIETMLQRLKAPFFIDGSEVFASASIGICLYPEHGRSYDVLRKNADTAMYRAKNEAKGTAILFDSGMEREALARMETEQALRQAILDRRFCCAFQPKVDIRTKEIKGIEALVRLRNDNGVIHAPGTFINLAVELGLIDEITHLVLEEIVKSIDLIDDAFGAGANISINVAAKQAGNSEFMISFAKAIAATGYPERFVIEVTEDAFVAGTQFQTEILPTFQRIGVKVSIDDFGIGYSSLSALADIAADEIKIDRSFITDIHKRPRSQGILKAIESLSAALGMTVIAEGVETFEELAYLQAATTIRYVQGYYFSKPIFLEELQTASRPVSDVRANITGRARAESRASYSRAG